MAKKPKAMTPAEVIAELAGQVSSETQSSETQSPSEALVGLVTPDPVAPRKRGRPRGSGGGGSPAVFLLEQIGDVSIQIQASYPTAAHAKAAIASPGRYRIVRLICEVNAEAHSGVRISDCPPVLPSAS